MLQLTAFAPALRPLLGQAPPAPRSAVAVIQGNDRRKNIAAALEAIDDQIRPALLQKKYVVIKPNFVSTTNQLAATHPNAVHGILDYLEPRFKGPVMVAEASAGDTMEAFEEFRFQQVVKEHKPLRVDLVDLNREARYVTIPLIDYDLHARPARLGARLMDLDAFVICAPVMKTHNTVVATLSVKNMTLGAPLHSAPGVRPEWNDKRVTHNGLRQTHYNMFLTAQAMKPFWGATVIDAYEGMEGNGPHSGTPVASRLAIASRDYIAADRVGLEVMGIDPKWLGYLNFCGDFGVGQYDLSKIDIRGAKLDLVRRKYRLHPDIERELRWMGPMEDLPEVVG
jgi:uncharacterized protein (DUF362 family)